MNLFFQVDFNAISVNSLRLNNSFGGQMVARLMGYLRPPSEWQDSLNVCISYCNATLNLSGLLIANVSAVHTECSSIGWPENISTDRVPVDFESRKMVSIGPYSRQDEHSKMELQHFRDKDDPPKVG